MRPTILWGGAAVAAVVLLTATLLAGGGSPSNGVPAAAAATAPGPANTSRPTITGSARDGDTLTASPGTWSGSGEITYAYQWQLCTDKGAECKSIDGATQQTYTLLPADVGSTIAVAVIATDANGSSTAYSDLAGPVAPKGEAPAYTTQPSIDGSAREGATLTVDKGAWSGSTPIAFTYQWMRCDAAGKNCELIGGPTTASAYKLTSRDVGHTIIVGVIATNAFGTQTGFTKPTAGVLGTASLPPAWTVRPAVAGTARVGETLTASNGTWRGATPMTFSYQWERCDAAGKSCASIARATATTYKVATQDAGHRLLVAVTARNAFGVQTGFTNPTAVVVPAASLLPASTVRPAVAGTARVGETLTASNGTWRGATPMTFSYQWERCDAAGKSCDRIAGATANTYKVGAGDAGHTLLVAVTARNAYGVQTAFTAATGVVATVVARTGAVAVSSVALPNRLVVSGVAFTPRVLTPRAPRFTARFRVTDSAQHPVSGALVYAIGLPYGRVSNAAEVQTDANGYATITFRPLVRFTARRGYIVFFVRARKPGDSLLAGVSTRRLVQVTTTR